MANTRLTTRNSIQDVFVIHSASPGNAETANKVKHITESLVNPISIMSNFLKFILSPPYLFNSISNDRMNSIIMIKTIKKCGKNTSEA